LNPCLRALAAGAALLLAASCTAPPDSRYATDQDAAPERPISPEQVVDAVPRPDPILLAGNYSPYSVDGVTYEVLSDHRGYREEGLASWYGAKFDGYATSNGEIYDLYKATAAHRTLPIPSYARVTNLENGASVVVRVNDRGPFHSERLIDLSYAAAVKLGYMEQGIARVRVESIAVEGADDRRGSVAGSYRYIQLGAFSSEASARRLREEVAPLLAAPVFVSQVDAGATRLYRVRIGPVADAAQLEAVRQTLLDGGYGAGQPLP